MRWFFLVIGVVLLIYAQSIGSKIDSTFAAELNNCLHIATSTSSPDNSFYLQCAADADKSKNDAENIRLLAYVVGGLSVAGAGLAIWMYVTEDKRPIADRFIDTSSEK